MMRRIALLFLTGALAVPVAVLGHTETAAASGGLVTSSTTTYTVDATSGVVHVLAEMTFTNTLPDRREGNYIQRRYFSGFSLPAPAGALNPMATTSNGRALRISPRFVEDSTNYFLIDVDFASNLFYQQTARVRVTYDITGLPPRSDNPSRVNPAYAAFDAWGIGDDGKVTVRVVVPAGFEIDTFGSDAVVTQEFGNTVYTATNIPNPDEFFIFVSARNDGSLALEEHTDPSDRTFQIRAWPGDDEWVEFVQEQIDEGIPALEELIGQPWTREDLEIREAYTPYLYGYAGWFSASENEIELGEDLDQEVTLHELSHAWFNNDWFRDRWLNEGFAQVYSNAAVDELGGDPIVPTTPRTGSSAGRVLLNQWSNPSISDGADEVETYGYNASYWVVQELYDEVGADGMRLVLAAVADKTIPYVGEDEPESVSFSTDWRRFLDLMEEVGGSERAAELIEQYVATPGQADLLEDREAARDAYHALVEEGGEWAVPYVVRNAMSDWNFTDAEQAIDEAGDLLALRDELGQRAGELGVGYPDTFETDYQAATKDEELAAVADDVQAQIDSAEQLLAAVAAEAEDHGLFGKIGLIGTDLPGLLDDARTAFAAGDLDAAAAAATKVTDTLDKADDVGKQRSLTVGAIVLGVLLVLAGLLWWRHRRRARRAALAAEGAEGAEGAGDGQDADGSERDAAERDGVEADGSDDTVPDDTVPDDTVPDDTVPDDTVPDDTVPDDTVPDPPSTQQDE